MPTSSKKHSSVLKKLVSVAAPLVLFVAFILPLVVPTHVIAAPVCDLSVSLSTETNTVLPQSTTTYSLTVTNEGEGVCDTASVSVYYPKSVGFVSASPTPSASTNYYWLIGSIPSGEKTIISFSTSQKVDDTSLSLFTEACVTAHNGNDACSDITIAVGGLGTLPEEEVVEPEPEIDVDPEPTPAPALTPTEVEQEYGSWVWVSPRTMTPSYRDWVIRSAVENNINVLYLTIDDYLDVYTMKDGVAKDAARIAYGNSIETFIRAANEKGIAVDAEAGWKDWGEPSMRWKAVAIVDYVKQYNAERTYTFRGIQYDIEPYLMSNYTTKANKAKLLKNFVQLVDMTRVQLANSDIAFSIVIPHFYDDRQSWTPSFSYGGVNAFTFNHLLRIMNMRPDSSIILMSYRNFTEGTDGSVYLSQEEIQDAEAIEGTTKIIVAQEVGNVKPAYVTFYGKSKAEYLSKIQILRDTFAPFESFGGISVNYIDPLMDLR